jgi:hypothetical protein
VASHHRSATVLVVLALLAGACGQGDDGGARAEACAPALQTGCGADEKCTWIRAEAGTSQQLGLLGCAPAGDQGEDAECRYGAAGEATGYDDCAPGLVCLADPSIERAAGTCRPICDLAAAGACGDDFACSAYVSFFHNRSEPAQAGVCDPTCDPLAQTRDVDGAPACGSPDPDAPTLGCYDAAPTPNPVVARPPSFSCAVIAGEVGHRGEAVDDRGDSYTNMCAPGHIMGFYDSDAAADRSVVCLRLCRPVDTHLGAPDGAQGAAPFRCDDERDECRYWWFFDGSTFADAYGPNPFTNQLGICWRPSAWHYDTDGDLVGDTVWPSCRELSDQDDPGAEPEDLPGAPDTTPEHLEWGCGPLPLDKARRRAPRIAPISHPRAALVVGAR